MKEVNSVTAEGNATSFGELVDLITVAGLAPGFRNEIAEENPPAAGFDRRRVEFGSRGGNAMAVTRAMERDGSRVHVATLVATNGNASPARIAGREPPVAAGLADAATTRSRAGTSAVAAMGFMAQPTRRITTPSTPSTSDRVTAHRAPDLRASLTAQHAAPDQPPVSATSIACPTDSASKGNTKRPRRRFSAGAFMLMFPRWLRPRARRNAHTAQPAKIQTHRTASIQVPRGPTPPPSHQLWRAYERPTHTTDRTTPECRNASIR